MEFVPEKWWIRGTLVLHVCRAAKTKEFLYGQKHVFHAQFKSVGKNKLCILSKQKFLKLVTNAKIDWSKYLCIVSMYVKEITKYENHEGARHCRKPLGRSVRQSFNKQELSNFYQFGYSTAFVWYFVKLFLLKVS